MEQTMTIKEAIGSVDLSAADRQKLEEVTRFVDEEVIPVASKGDRQEVYPADLIERMKELGLFGACLGPLPLYSLIQAEIARGWVSLAPALNGHSMTVWALKNYGTDEQKARWLDDLISGAKVASFGLTENEAGSDLQAITSTAVRDGDEWVVNAHKAYITHSGHADILVLLVRTETSEGRNHRGQSLIVLEKGEWRVIREMDKLGTRAIETCELIAENVRVDAGRVIGPESGRGFQQAMDALEVGRLAVAGAAVGVGRAALWAAIERSKERKAFGQRIGEFQTVAAALGRTAIQLKAAQALTLQAAAAKQQGGRQDLITMAAKVFTAETAVAAALSAMELHGGAGYLKDYDVERFLRDSTLYLIGEGANGVLTSIIGKRLLGMEPSVDFI